METQPDCPDAEKLSRYLDGDEDDALVQHVESCASCSARLTLLQDDDDLEERLFAARVIAHGVEPTGAIPEIDGYEIEGEIHRGGQGVVFRARQLSTKRTVAIKLLLEGTFASERQRQRFEREVELAASLDHPGIVAVHDSGVTRDGRSYFVMEYVAGVPTNRVGERCDRVELAIAICEAVEAAHLRGVLHRDLKPGNILVDASDRPHVLDFGLAAPSTHEDDSPRLTRTGEFMGTLAYASPEHVTGDPDQLDVRSDVFALGVILYELFTGRLPYHVGGSTLEAVRAVAEAEPAPMRGHGSAPRGGRVDPELETVVRTALAKDKARRYPSAGALAEDLRRYRDREPLWARRDSMRYVLAKSLRRYRWQVAALAVLFLVAAGSSIAIFFLYGRVQDERDQAVRQGGRATEISAFFKDALRSISPEQARGHTVAVREVLDEASKQLASRPPRYPEAELELRLSVGVAYRDLGLPVEASPHLERAVTLARELEGSTSRTLGNALMLLGDVQAEIATLDRVRESYGQALAIFASCGDIATEGLTETRLARLEVRTGDMTRAAAHAERALELLERAEVGPFAISIAQHDWANVLFESGEYDAAEREARASLERTRAADGTVTEAYTHRLLGLILWRQGKDAEAREELDVALEAHRRLFGENHTRTLLCRIMRAIVVLQSEGREAARSEVDACLEQREFLRSSRDAFGARALSNLGLLMELTGDFELAVGLHREALEVFDAVFAEDTLYEAFTRSGLAWALFERGASREAHEQAIQAIAVIREQFGERHARVAPQLAVLGWIAIQQGRTGDALELGREALACAGSDESSLARVTPLVDLGAFLYFNGENDQALARLEEAVRLLDESGRPPDDLRARALHFLGEVLRDTSRPAEAEAVLREALELRRLFLGARHPRTAQTMNALAVALFQEPDASDECKALLEDALDALRDQGEQYTYTAWVLNNLGAWYRSQTDDLDAARRYIVEGVEHARRTAASNHPLLAINLANLGIVESLDGDHAEARRLLEESHGILVEVRGAGHPQTLQVLGLLISECEALGDEEGAEAYRALKGT